MEWIIHSIYFLKSDMVSLREEWITPPRKAATYEPRPTQFHA